MKKVLLFATILLCACAADKEHEPDEVAGTALVSFTADFADYADDEADTRSVETTKCDTVYAFSEEGDSIACTLERVRTATATTTATTAKGTTRATMAAGTKIRVYVYNTDSTYVTDGIITVGSSTDAIALNTGTDYIIRAVSYNANDTFVPLPPSTANLNSASIATNRTHIPTTKCCTPRPPRRGYHQVAAAFRCRLSPY